MSLSLVGRQAQETDVRMFTKNPTFKQCFALLVGNPESDDLYVTVYDSGPEQDKDRRKIIGSLKLVISRLLRRSTVSMTVRSCIKLWLIPM